MKKEYKLLKLRFSYFLIIGLIGLFLIGISFFVWNSTSITPTMIMTKITSSNPQFKKYLNNYMAPQKVQLVGYLFLVIMSCGFFFASKKKDIEIRIGSIIEFVSNFSCLILVIIELIFAYTNRTTFLLKKNDGFINYNIGNFFCRYGGGTWNRLCRNERGSGDYPDACDIFAYGTISGSGDCTVF